MRIVLTKLPRVLLSRRGIVSENTRVSAHTHTLCVAIRLRIGIRIRLDASSKGQDGAERENLRCGRVAVSEGLRTRAVG